MISYPNFNLRTPSRAQAVRKPQAVTLTAKEQVDSILLAVVHGRAVEVYEASPKPAPELIDFVRSSPCHCSAALAPLPAIQCERCRLLARCGATA